MQQGIINVYATACGLIRLRDAVNSAFCVALTSPYRAARDPKGAK